MSSRIERLNSPRGASGSGGFACILVLLVSGCTGTIGSADQGGARGPEEGSVPPPGPGTPAEAGCSPGQDTLPPQRVWMLTPEQLPATVASLYGDGPKGPQLEVVTEANRTYLGNDSDLLKINAEQTRSLLTGTEGIARFVAERIEQFSGCAIDAPACFTGFVTDFATRAWRTPPTDKQLGGLRGIYTVGAEISPREGWRLALTAILKSPRFLYRTEIGAREANGAFRLTPWETAAQLSYLLLDAPPDRELRQLAADGSIARPDVFAQQADRLLRDPRARALAGRFLGQLTGADSLRGVVKDKAGPLGFGDDVTSALREELRLFSEWVFFDAGGSIGDLFTRKETFVNNVVANFYGSDVKASQNFARAPLGGARSGLLSMPAVMATHSQSDHVVPTTRGRFVFSQLLCIPIANPPQFPADLPAARPELTPRQRLDVMKDFPACVGCHNMLDPVGFAFDGFDHVGRAVSTVKGVPVDPSGYIKNSGSSDGTFGDLPGLANLLGSSEEVRRCVHSQFLEFSQGRAFGEGESCAIEDSFRKLETGGGKLAGLVRSALDFNNLQLRGASR